MDPNNKEKTSFTTKTNYILLSSNAICVENYKRKLPIFGQQNVPTILRKIMEVYIDFMLVKSLKVEKHIYLIEQNFQILEQYQMKLNQVGILLPSC